MSTITTIQATDKLTDSRTTINTNFANLNSDKAEKASNLSDMTVPNTALNNILPTQTAQAGKQLQTDGTNTSWQSPSGSPLATNIVQGLVALSVVAANPALPNAVGDNDPRMPTQGQKDAMVGTGTPATANPYVTKDTDDLKELLTNKSTTTTLGTSNTLYPSQNAVKTYVDTQVATIPKTINTVSAATVSDTLQWSDDAELTVSATSYTKYKEILINENLAAVRVKCTTTGSGGNNIWYTLYKNGVAIGTEHAGGNPSATGSDDITNLVAGDLLQIYCYINSGTHTVKDFKLYFTKTITKIGVLTLTTPLSVSPNSFIINPTNNS